MNKGLKWTLAVAALMVGSIAVYKTVTVAHSANFVVERIESLNGAIGIAHPLWGPQEIHFAMPGLEPLITDQDVDELARHLARLRIRKLNITNTKITDPGFRVLVSALRGRLRVISMSGAKVTSESLAVLVNCPDLRHLSLSVSLLSDEGIEDLSKLQSLQEVVVYECKPDDHRIATLKKKLPSSVRIRCREKRHMYADEEST